MSKHDLHRDAQKRIQAILDELVDSGNDRGLQVAVYHDGKLVVDAWAGEMDAATGRKVDGDTLFPVFSTGKGVAATAVNVLAGRGVLDYDAPLARTWPGFEAKDKSSITLRHALTHSAGLPNMPACRDAAEACDWGLMCRKVAELEPLWPAGTQLRYHAITYSWLVGEPARLADGRDFGRIVREEVARPLGVEDSMFFGINDQVQHRVATLDTLNPITPPAVEDPAIPRWVWPLHEWMNRRDTQRACIPGSNAIMSARAIARHYAALVPGGVEGVELLPPRTLQLARTLYRLDGVPIEQLPRRGSLGYNLAGPIDDVGSVLSHGGYGGSTGYANIPQRLAVGVAKVTMDSPRSAADLVGQALTAMLAG